jgi:hypothetical protein
VFFALGTQREMHMRHNVIYGLSDSTIFFHIISQTVRFPKEEIFVDYEISVLIFVQSLSETFLILRRTERDMIKNL